MIELTLHINCIHKYNYLLDSPFSMKYIIVLLHKVLVHFDVILLIDYIY